MPTFRIQIVDGWNTEKFAEMTRRCDFRAVLPGMDVGEDGKEGH